MPGPGREGREGGGGGVVGREGVVSGGACVSLIFQGEGTDAEGDH